MRGVRAFGAHFDPYLQRMSGDAYPIRDQNDLYFLTFTVVEWMDIFTRLSHRMILVDSLNYCVERKGLVVNAWVVLSNHMHMIAYAQEGKKMSDLIRDFKTHTSKAIRGNIESEPESRRRWLLDIMAFTARKTGRTDDYKLWQDGSHAVPLTSEKFIHQKLEYIHQNPVENGLVALPEHYVFSSARDYFTGKKGLVKIELL